MSTRRPATRSPDTDPQPQVEEFERRVHELEAESADAALLRDDLRLKDAYLIELRATLRRRERELGHELAEARRALELLQRSPSWRITAPLRRLKAWLGARRVGGRGSDPAAS